MTSWFKDPLWVFLVIGAALLLAAELWSGDDADQTVVVGEADIARLNAQWQTQMRRAPSETELAGLIEAFVREEIYYREAQRLGLDQNDTIVRRRLVQKLTFLTEDVATAAEPEEAALQDHYAANEARYTQPERVSFRHRYFSVDRRETAEQDAIAALSDPEIAGDPFMLQRAYAERSEREIGDLFGREFAAALFAITGTGWQGPIRSAYGWHLVSIEARLPEAVMPFAQVRDKVKADLQMARRKDANERYYESLLDRYEVQKP